MSDKKFENLVIGIGLTIVGLGAYAIVWAIAFVGWTALHAG